MPPVLSSRMRKKRSDSDALWHHARVMHRTYAALVLVVLLGGAGCKAKPRPDREPSASPELGGTDPWRDELGGRTLADRGGLLRSVHAATFAQADVSKSLFFSPALGPATNGYELFVIQYVSEARPGVARAVTALLYLPTGGATNVPIVAVDHGGSGVGPSCGPSHVPFLTDPLAIPLVGRGYAVVAPDYAGMGVDNGMTSFLVGAAEAAATLDGVRALRQLHDPRFDARQLGTELFVVGHSQGAHAALFTHQLFDASIGVDLLGSVAISPGLGSARRWAGHFTDPSRPVGAMEATALMSLYAHMLYAGGPPAGAWLSPAAQAKVPALLHDVCQPLLPGFLRMSFATVGDLYQPAFLAAAARCKLDGAACPDFEPWASMLVKDEPGRITSAVPSLVLQGLADFVVEPSSVACVVDRMKERRTPVQACGYAGADHVSVIERAVPDMVRWIAGRRAGATPDVCAAPLALSCQPGR